MYVYWTAKVYLIALMNFMALAYPVACLIVLYVVLLLLRWSSTCWCEQMREALEVNWEETIPLH